MIAIPISKNSIKQIKKTLIYLRDQTKMENRTKIEKIY